MKGKFITIEGCEGAGKSAQLRLLTEYLTEHGVEFISTREPGGTPVAEKIRAVILDADNKGMADECEALLYAAARAEHLKNKVIPAIEAGKLVICDRFIDSSFAYQVYARGLDFSIVERANFFAIENCMPDATLFLNISPKDAFKRKGGADKKDRIELEGLEFHERVYGGYLSLCERYPDRIIKIDCSGEKAQTHANILAALRERKIIE